MRVSCVLDDSVTMHWFFGDRKPKELAYAGKVLDAMKHTNAIVPVIWGAGSGERHCQGRGERLGHRGVKCGIS